MVTSQWPAQHNQRTLFFFSSSPLPSVNSSCQDSFKHIHMKLSFLKSYQTNKTPDLEHLSSTKRTPCSSIQSLSTFRGVEELHIGSNSNDIDICSQAFAVLSSIHLYCIVCVQCRCQVCPQARLASSAWLAGDKAREVSWTAAPADVSDTICLLLTLHQFIRVHVVNRNI